MANGVTRVKVTIAGYYDILPDYAMSKEAYGTTDPVKMVEIDRQTIVNGNADVYDVVEWLDSKPEITLEIVE